MGAEAVFRLGSGAGILPAASSNSLLRSFASLLAASPMHVSDLENDRMYVALILGIMVLTNVSLRRLYMKRWSPSYLAKLKTWTVTSTTIRILRMLGNATLSHLHVWDQPPSIHRRIRRAAAKRARKRRTSRPVFVLLILSTLHT